METSLEDYLKAIFKLQEKPDSYVKTQAISAKLQITQAAVSEMIKRLAEKGFVQHTPYRGVCLTKKGLQLGQNIVRRHRILETYLNRVLGFSWDQVHEEAERLEHAASDVLIDKMEEKMRFPQYDPHGDPIPSADGRIPKLPNVLPLSAAHAGIGYEVVRVSDSNKQFLTYLDKLGLKLHCFFHLQDVLSFDKSMVIRINGLTHNISQGSTEHIWVKPISNKMEGYRGIR